MRALRFHGRGDLRVEDVAEPELRPGTVKVAVSWCGICGSDVHEHREGPRVVPAAGRPHPLTGEHAPLTLGHEIAGVVIEREGDEGPAPGTTVAIDPLLACGRCPPCRRGTPHRCRIGGALGLIGAGGGFAERAVVDAARAHPVPDGVAPDVAALVEPLAVGWHAVARGGVQAGDAVLVIGAGPIGLACLAAARAAGAERVVVSVRSPGARVATALTLGADALAHDADAARGAAPDGGYDVVLDTAGNADGLRLALGVARPGAVVVDVGLWMEPARINLNKLLARELSLVGSMGYEAGDFPAVIAALAAGALGDVATLITARVPLERAIEDGFEALTAQRAEHVKILVAP